MQAVFIACQNGTLEGLGDKHEQVLVVVDQAGHAQAFDLSSLLTQAINEPGIYNTALRHFQVPVSVLPQKVLEEAEEIFVLPDGSLTNALA